MSRLRCPIQTHLLTHFHFTCNIFVLSPRLSSLGIKEDCLARFLSSLRSCNGDASRFLTFPLLLFSRLRPEGRLRQDKPNFQTIHVVSSRHNHKGHSHCDTFCGHTMLIIYLRSFIKSASHMKFFCRQKKKLLSDKQLPAVKTTYIYVCSQCVYQDNCKNIHLQCYL